jgi:arginine utilization protein RocB
VSGQNLGEDSLSSDFRRRAALRYRSRMPDRLDAAATRALAERLVAIPSVSPDPLGEAECIAELRAALPKAMSHGTWPTTDGRPVLWALLRGPTARTAVLLGHCDTVGVEEFAHLDGRPDGAIAFHPEALRARMVREGSSVSPALRADLAEEVRTPGTWMFGRGALDMKSGLAAGVAALERLADGADRLPGSVLLVVCPDEENQSAGMEAALPRIAALRDREGLELRGLLNLDYAERAGGYAGVMGKLLVGTWVLGRPTHACAPQTGVDATQLAAEIVRRITTHPGLADDRGGEPGPPPVALRLRDLKTRYDVQTAREAVAEFNVLIASRPLEPTLARLCRVVRQAMTGIAAAMGGMAPAADVGSVGLGSAEPAVDRVLTVPELMRLAGSDVTLEAARSRDYREVTLSYLRGLTRAARIEGPAVIVHLLPPYYPPAAPGSGALVEAARRVLDARDLPLSDFYPYISDAAYAAWRAEPVATLEPHLPALGRGYRLPHEAAAALDLDVVTVGPWGRDAHGLGERVHAPYAFGVLPDLIAEIVRETVGS